MADSDPITEALLLRLAEEQRAYLPTLIRRLGVRGPKGGRGFGTKQAIQAAIDRAEPALRAAGWIPRHRGGLLRGGYRNAIWKRGTFT